MGSKYMICQSSNIRLEFLKQNKKFIEFNNTQLCIFYISLLRIFKLGLEHFRGSNSHIKT